MVFNYVSVTIIACLVFSGNCNPASGRLNARYRVPPSEDTVRMESGVPAYFLRATRLANGQAPPVKEEKTPKGSSAVFAPYLMFKVRPPVAVTLPLYSKYALECEVSGSPNPRVHWEVNGAVVSPQDHNQELRSPSTLSLSMIKSRLFLDCMTEDMQADYQCVGVSDRDRIVATTTVKVIRPALRIETQEEELLSQNSIDYKGVNAKAMREVEAIRSGCIEKRMMGTRSPARIHQWTLTALEYIGQDVIIQCRALGFPKPTYTWFANDKLVEPDFVKYEVLSSGDLRIRNSTFDDMGKYKCIASNMYGTDSVDKIFFYPTEPTKEEDEQ